MDGGPRRLVHGVLGTLLRRGLPDLPAPRLPEAVEARWRDAWGDQVVAAARRQIANRPPLDLSFADAAKAEAFIAAHGGTSLAPRHVRIGSSAVSELPDFSAGDWWVQDLAASLPARLVPAEARTVLDLCAAPGGKTMQLAAAGHGVIAVDNSKSRLGRLRENLERTHLRAELAEADALEVKPHGPIDAILLDAPCSSTGTFRRHPEILYRARPAIITEAAELQGRLLRHAAGLLPIGGTLVYAVCSLEPQEGEEVVDAFLADSPRFRTEPPRRDELPDVMTPSPQGWVRVVPGLLEAQGGLDGFFMARLVRTN